MVVVGEVMVTLVGEEEEENNDEGVLLVMDTDEQPLVVLC